MASALIMKRVRDHANVEFSNRWDGVAIGLDGRFTGGRPDYARQLHEGVARGLLDTAEGQKQLDQLLRDHIVISEEERVVQVLPFAGWTPHNRRWYLDQHDLTDDPIPSARNKRPATPPIYVEHRPFLFGAGNDHHRIFVTEEGTFVNGEGIGTSVTKIPMSGYKILNTIVDLPKTFLHAIFATVAFGYDVAQILRCLDADTAGKLQAGEIVIKTIDDDGAPCEEVVEQAVFFWNEFAISYRRSKMFRVGRLNDPANPYKYKEITDP